MKTTSFTLPFTLLLWTMSSMFVFAEEKTTAITECDIQAGHPSDPDHVGEGKLTPDVDTAKAIPACREALKKSPSTPRFHYQLGRVLVYGGEFIEGRTHVKHAADMGHSQGQFVFALLSRETPCEGEKFIKAAANQGLKSARITYVNDFLSGIYANCKVSASKDDMTAYLNAASAQMSGYYETMLVNVLLRELSQHQETK